MLTWMPSNDPDVVRYRIYYGTESQSYVNQVTVDNTNVATISGLADGITYYLNATAITGAGIESPFSDELVYTTPSAAATLTVQPVSAGQFSFNVDGVEGYQYVVESSTNLLTWAAVQTNTAPFTFTAASTPDVPQQFYRTLYLPPPGP